MTHLVPVLRPVLGTPFRRGSLYRAAGEVPSFHIAPARTRNATDLITGSVLGTYNSASPAWAVGPDGVLFQPAANAPVIEYDPATLQCLGARIWGAVTNGHIYSEDATQWQTPIGITLTANQGTAPTGSPTADRYIETATFGQHLQEGVPLTFVSGTQYTYSVFVKSIGDRNFEIGYQGTVAGALTRLARFNLSTGVIQGADSGITAGITAYPGGYYRCSATVTATASVTARMINFINDASFSRNYAGDTSKGLFIWGAQLNTGPLAPYVPTTTTAASSTADVWTITGADFSRIINQTEGTIYIEYGPHDVLAPGSNNSLFTITTSTTTAADLIESWVGSSIAPVTRVQSNSVNQVLITSLNYSPSAIHKLAAAYKADDFARSLDTQPIGTDTSGALPAVAPSILEIGSRNLGGVKPLNGYIRELAILRSRRPNANLQAMTQ